MNTYLPTIGLEIHAELKTRTKMFCNSLNDPLETRPNVNICPICMGFPGTLPVANKEAIRHVLRVGTALGGRIADYTEFDRKNYFYPDLPKGYQISQYEYPLVSGGTLGGVAITRIHLEEDAARSQHGSVSTDQNDTFSLVDFNRAGLPLMELVTEPVIHDAKVASFFAQELQRLLRALGAGEANMEKGQMRVEANISVSRDNVLGTKVEVKNINSFRAVEKAIAYEIQRQTKLLEEGKSIIQETRGWDENRSVTFPQRLKEGSHDYRYFPEPDIPKFRLSDVLEFSEEAIRASLPELPQEKRDRYTALGLKPEDVETLVADSRYSSFFDAEIAGKLSENADIKLSANYLLTDIRGADPTDEALLNLTNGAFADVIRLLRIGDLSSRGAKDVLAALMSEGGTAEKVARDRGLIQMKDANELDTLVDAVLADNPSIVEDIRKGKREALKFLVGQGMKKSKGAANPAELERSLQNKIEKR